MRGSPLNQQHLLHRTLDTCGIWVSLLCAAHCVLLPLLLVALPLLGMYQGELHEIEVAVLAVTTAIAITSFLWGYVTHGNPKALTAMGLAFGLLFLGHHFADELSTFHALLSAAGGLLLAFGHYLNRTVCRCSREVAPASSV